MEEQRAFARGFPVGAAQIVEEQLVSEDDVLDSPHVAIGSVDQIVEQLEMARERWAFNYLEVSSTDAEAVAPIMERLNGR